MTDEPAPDNVVPLGPLRRRRAKAAKRSQAQLELQREFGRKWAPIGKQVGEQVRSERADQ